MLERLVDDGASYTCGRKVEYDPNRDSVTCDRTAKYALPRNAFETSKHMYSFRALCEDHAKEYEDA